MTARGVATALIAVTAVVGCSGKKRIERNRDAAPVVKVDPGSGGRAVGGSVDEHEPNAAAAEATPLALGVTARGALDGAADVDVYKLAVTETGALRVTLSGIDGVDLALAVSDAGGAVIARSDRGPATTVEGVPNLGVVKGDYFLTVTEFVKPAKKPGKKKAGAVDAAPSGRQGLSPVYQLVAEVTAPATGTEREPDDDPGAANDLYPGDTVTGFVGWSGDKDVWKLSLEALSQRNGFDVEVTPVDGVMITVEVADAAGAPLQTRKGGKGATVALRAIAPRQPEGSPPFHYVTISGDRSNPEVAYTLAVRGRLVGLDEEVEPNDKPDVAMPLPGTSGTIKAASAPGDVDCFGLAAAADAQALVFTVAPADGVDAVIELSVPTGMLAKTDLGAAGATEKAEVTIPAGVAGTACVSFKPVKADPGTPRDYDVEFSVEAVADALPPEQ
jgi:hypothetical protein